MTSPAAFCDELYGPGAFDALQATCTFGGYVPTFQAEHDPDSGQYLGLVRWTRLGEPVAALLAWTDGRSKDMIHFKVLRVEPAFQRAGILTELAKRLPDWARQHGITVVFAQASGESREALWRIGFTDIGDDPQSPMQATVDPGDRLEEYARWKRGESPEPDWHKDGPPPYPPLVRAYEFPEVAP